MFTTGMADSCSALVCESVMSERRPLDSVWVRVTLDKAFEFAQKAVNRNETDPLALICLSALYGQKGDLDGVINVLSKHEAKMINDVRLANNYFEALFQKRQIERVTKLLNALAGSSNREVKQFAIERSRAVAQFLQRQQQELAGAQRRV